MRLNPQQWALIISVLSTAIIVVAVFSVRLKSMVTEEVFYEIDFKEDLTEDLAKLKQAFEKQDIKTHRAYNETEKIKKAKGPAPIKSLEELQKEIEASKENETSSDTDFNRKLAELAKERDKLQKEKNKIKEEEVTTDQSNTRQASVSFAIEGRHAVYLPIPTYTCIVSGLIKIDVEINSIGKVIHANYNKGGSTSTNGCLIDNALAYAQKAVFSSKSNLNKQSGSITYVFQGK